MWNNPFWAKAFDKAWTAKELCLSFGIRDGLDFSNPLHIHTQQNHTADNLSYSLMLDANGNQIPVHQPTTCIHDQKCMERPITKFHA